MRTYYIISNAFFFCSALCIDQTIRLGVENIPSPVLSWLKTRRVGLIVNHTSITQSGERTIDFLLQKSVRIARIFAPEHGLNGTIQAEKNVHDTYDDTTNIPVMSVYNTGPKRAMTDHKVEDLDVLIFDMQDAGMRHFTYISTLLHMMQCAAHYHIPFMVLDRPNPLGYCMEGPVGQLLCLPHVTLASLAVPLRHGLTIGELARYFNHEALHDAVDVQVIPMQGYIRSMTNPPVACYKLSPNIQSKNSCYGYSFLGLLGEVRPFDIGIATENAFACVLLPEDVACSAATWHTIKQLFERHHITCSWHNYMSARKKKRCRGFKLALQDCNTIHSFTLFIQLLQLLQKAGISLVFSKGFDHAMGSDAVRLVLNGTLDYKQLALMIHRELHAFYQRVLPFLLYTPVPKIIEL